MRTALAVIAALGLAACGPKSNEATTGNTTMPDATNETAMGNAAANASDSLTTVATPDFITKAAISDMYEIAAAKVALQRSRSSGVKDFANMMVRDHTATSDQVKAIVARNNLPAPPTALDDAHARMIADLKSAKAEDFDTTYLDQQTAAHGDALSLLQSYAQSGDNADLKAFAAETAPKVQTHLDKARSLDHAGADDQAAAKPAR